MSKHLQNNVQIVGNLVGNVTGNLTGNVTGNVTGNLTGTADYADVATSANSATYATQLAVTDQALTVTATPAGGTFTISGADAHAYDISTVSGLYTLRTITMHFTCASSTGGAGVNFPLIIGFSGATAVNYTEVLCNVTTSTTARTLSGVIAAGDSDITVAASNGLNPAAGQNWSIAFTYLTN